MTEDDRGAQGGLTGKGRSGRGRWFRSLWAQAAVIAPALLIVIAGFVVAYQFVEPAPPDRVVMATGSPDGAYTRFGKVYAERFKAEGVDLSLKTTAGSLENLDLLMSPDSGVAVAFMQGGIGSPRANPDLVSLGSIYYEPIWVFVRGIDRPRRLTQLKGLHVAVGGVGSGTRAVALKLLADNGITPQNTTLHDLGGGEAAEALRAGHVDAAILVVSVASETVRKLLAEPGIAPMSFERADAYLRRNSYLSKVVLPEGTVDLAANLPREDTVLLAPAATIVASPRLHPAHVDLLLLAMFEAHRDGGDLERPGEFPSAQFVTFPLDPAARRFYDRGPPFLQRYLPFAVANLIDRLKIMVLPLLTLLYPLFKILPPAYSWRMRARVNRWYKSLQALDDRVREGHIPHDEAVNALDALERAVEHVSVPAGFADRIYALRLHINYLRQKFESGASGSGNRAVPGD